MNSSQFFSRRRVLLQRVASIFSLSLAVGLTACSSHGLPFTESGAIRFGQNNDGTVPIPSEPVNGHSKKARAAKADRSIPAARASRHAEYRPASIQRQDLAPVRTASYDGGSGGYAGNSFSMQPVAAHERTGGRTTSASGARYAQASGYNAPGYQSSYSDYDPPRRRRHEAPKHDYNRRSYDDRRPVRDYSGAKHHDEYVVVEGDTLYAIAKRYGLSTSELARLNGIRSSTIYAGQRLRVGKAPEYTAAHRDRLPPRYNTSGPREDYTSYEAEERKAPAPDYSSYSANRSYTGSYDSDRDRAPASDYAASPKRSYERYSRRHEAHRQEERGQVNYYRKPKGSYHSYAVERGDSLYEIARRHGLSHRELADFNDIPVSATLYPGQILHLPKGRGYDRSQERYDGRPYRRYREGGRRDDARRVPVSQKSDGKAEDRRQGERRLARVKQRPVEKRAEPQAVQAQKPKREEPEAKPQVQPASAPAQERPVAEPEEKAPRTILAAHRDVDAGERAERRVAAPRDCESLLASPAARSSSTFREPVQGLIVAKFGTKKDGSFNDGIDFSVPKGTPVKVAENGVVAYVGNELSGFGNLILVRHADGYVTAYAHNDQVMVRRCDVVKRGQVISKAGATGKVSQPQLHFELRKDSKAIDPEAYFSRS